MSSHIQSSSPYTVANNLSEFNSLSLSPNDPNTKSTDAFYGRSIATSQRNNVQNLLMQDDMQSNPQQYAVLSNLQQDLAQGVSKQPTNILYSLLSNPMELHTPNLPINSATSTNSTNDFNGHFVTTSQRNNVQNFLMQDDMQSNPQHAVPSNFQNDFAQGVSQQHNPKQPSFECELCDRTFSFKVNLARHKRTVHSEKRPYECKTCSRRFKTKYNLTSHERHVHGRKIFYVCTFCNKYCLFSTGLKKHIKTHHPCTDKLSIISDINPSSDNQNYNKPEQSLATKNINENTITNTKLNLEQLPPDVEGDKNNILDTTEDNVLDISPSLNKFLPDSDIEYYKRNLLDVNEYSLQNIAPSITDLDINIDDYMD